MKVLNVFLSMVLMFSVSVNLYSQTTNETRTATVYLIRAKNAVGSLLPMKINVANETEIKLTNGSIKRLNVAPGLCTISCQMGTTARVQLNLVADSVYYIACYVLRGLSGTPDLIQIDGVSGRELIAEMTPKPVSSDYYTEKTASKRIGLQMGYGVGMNPITLGTTTQGNVIKLNTAGGLYAGLEIGDQSTKNFDISASVFYQRCELMPSISNGSGRFERFGFLVSPSIVIPINGGETSRLRLVGGPGLYVGTAMHLNIPSLGYNNVSLQYWPAFGFHASATYDRNVTENSTFSIGLKYTLLEYTYKDMDDTDSRLDENILYPKGSGVDFLLGYYLRF